MDSSQLTRFKKDRSTANAINGTSPKQLLSITEETYISFKQGSKLSTYNKRIILPGCKGPTCNKDMAYIDSMGTFEWTSISTLI